MKRLISIPLLVLILFSGININIASHYCGGRLAATKVSLNGETASCGMEDHPVKNTPNGSITKHCCEDLISSISTGHNYVPSANIFLPDKGPELSHLFILRGDANEIQNKNLSYSFYIIRPPGCFIPNDVDQQSICIFRI